MKHTKIFYFLICQFWKNRLSGFEKEFLRITSQSFHQIWSVGVKLGVLGYKPRKLFFGNFLRPYPWKIDFLSLPLQPLSRKVFLCTNQTIFYSGFFGVYMKFYFDLQLKISFLEIYCFSYHGNKPKKILQLHQIFNFS